MSELKVRQHKLLLLWSNIYVLWITFFIALFDTDSPSRSQELFWSSIWAWSLPKERPKRERENHITYYHLRMALVDGKPQWTITLAQPKNTIIHVHTQLNSPFGRQQWEKAERWSSPFLTASPGLHDPEHEQNGVTTKHTHTYVKLPLCNNPPTDAVENKTDNNLISSLDLSSISHRQTGERQAPCFYSTHKREFCAYDCDFGTTLFIKLERELFNSSTEERNNYTYQ